MANPSALRADCPSCGTVEIALDHAVLVLGFEQPAPGHTLQYTCPSCGATRTDHLGERATRLLMAAGIGLVGTTQSAPIAPDGPGTR